MSKLNSTIPLYFAKSGVNTPMSSPPFDTVTAATERNDKYPFCAYASASFSLYSNSLFTPIIMGIIPRKPMANGGMAKDSNTASDDTATRIIIPRNCPTVTFRADNPGVMNNIIRINVSSILEAINAVIPIPISPIKSAILQRSHT